MNKLTNIMNVLTNTMNEITINNFNRFVKSLLHKIICFFIGHSWSNWDEFHYVPKGETGFITLAEKCSRECTRCESRQYREWAPKEQQLLKKHQERIQGNLNGYVGELCGIRFIQSNNVKTV